jgi:hypothetical protein
VTRYGERSGGKAARLPALAMLEGSVDYVSTSPEAIENLTRTVGRVANGLSVPNRPVLLAGMQWLYLRCMAQMAAEYDAGRAILPGDLRNYAVTMGIAIDKVQLLSGAPTEIVAGIHEVRHLLPALAERLARVSVGGGRAHQDGAVPAELEGGTA